VFKARLFVHRHRAGEGLLLLGVARAWALLFYTLVAFSPKLDTLVSLLARRARLLALSLLAQTVVDLNLLKFLLGALGLLLFD